MNYYIEPIGDEANEIIGGFLSATGDSIDPEIAIIQDKDGIERSVYVLKNHDKVTFLKKSRKIKIDKDFRVYTKSSGVLVPSFIDYKKVIHNV